MKKLLWVSLVVALLGIGYYFLVRSWHDSSMEEIPDGYFAISGYDQNILPEKNGLVQLQKLLFTYSGAIAMMDSVVLPGSGEALYDIPLTGSDEKVVYVGDTFTENWSRYIPKVGALYTGAEDQIKMLAAQSYNILQQYPVWQDLIVGTGVYPVPLTLGLGDVKALIRVLNAAALYNCSVGNYNDCSIFFSIAYGISYQLLQAKSQTIGIAIASSIADHTLANIQASIYNFGYTGDDQDILQSALSLPLDTQQVYTDMMKAEYRFIQLLLDGVYTHASSGDILKIQGNYNHEDTKDILKNYIKKSIEGIHTTTTREEIATYGTRKDSLSSLQQWLLHKSHDQLGTYMVRNGGGLEIVKDVMDTRDMMASRLKVLETRRQTILKEISN